jgi:hypothetical protein
MHHVNCLRGWFAVPTAKNRVIFSAASHDHKAGFLQGLQRPLFKGWIKGDESPENL